MKKGKYIDYNILLACLSRKPKGKQTNDLFVPGISGLKRVLVLRQLGAVKQVA